MCTFFLKMRLLYPALLITFLYTIICTIFAHTIHAKPWCRRTDGSLDITFGNKGTVVTDLGGSQDNAQGVVVLQDGSTVAVGYSNKGANNAFDFTLTRYTPHGALDTSFGTNGTVFTNFASIVPHPLNTPSRDQAYAAILQSCTARTSNQCPTSPCPTSECSNLPCSTCECSDLFNNDFYDSCKILVVGTSNVYSDSSLHSAFALARYHCDGTLDTSFGTNGIVITPIGTLFDQANAVAIQDDGKIVVAGSTAYSSLFFFSFYNYFALARYHCDGSIDKSFGPNRSGFVITNFGPNNPLLTPTNNDVAQAVKIQPNGKIVAAGYSDANHPSGFFHFALARYTSEGILDTSFGPSAHGKVITAFTPTSFDQAYALVLIEKNNNLKNNYTCTRNDTSTIIAIGFSDPNNSSGTTTNFALAAYTPQGDLDTTFGPSHTGLTTTDFSSLIPGHTPNTSYDYALAALLEKKCYTAPSIIAAGYSNVTGTITFALARYTSDGIVDPTFGNKGIVITNFPNTNNDQAYAIALTKKGFVVAGLAQALLFQQNIAVARYTLCQPCC